MNSQTHIYQNYIDALKSYTSKNNEARFVALQLLEMHAEVSRRKDVVVLELGVDRGQSTKAFLNAIDRKQSSYLVSVDIRDCSSVSNSDRWTFVQNDSSKVEQVLKSAPILKEGIDVIYVDSLHTSDHVYKEIYGWFPYLKKGGVMYFDDVDSGPYLQGQRKDSIGTEIANRKIYELIEAVFRGNLEQSNLVITNGSTGLARLEKISDLGAELNQPLYIRKRNNRIFWRLMNLIFRKKQYQHSQSNSDSFLIDVTKY